MQQTRASRSKLSLTGTQQTKEHHYVVIWKRRFHQGPPAHRAIKEWKSQLTITYSPEPSIRKQDNQCKVSTSMVLGKVRDSRAFKQTRKSWWCNSKCSSSRQTKQRMAKRVNLQPRRHLVPKEKARSATWSRSSRLRPKEESLHITLARQIRTLTSPHRISWASSTVISSLFVTATGRMAGKLVACWSTDSHSTLRTAWRSS